MSNPTKTELAARAVANLEFWKGGDEVFKSVAFKMLEKGFEVGEVETMLSDLHRAVAGEYGD